MAEETMTFPDVTSETLHEEAHADKIEQIGQYQTPSQEGVNGNDSATLGTEQRAVESGEDSATFGTERPATDLQSLLAAIPNEEQADSVRRIFAENTRLRQAEKSVDTNMEAAVKSAVEQALQEQGAIDQGFDPDDPMSQVTPEQKALFGRILQEQANELGFVKKDDLTQEKATDYLTRSDKEGVKMFGDSFGLEDSEGVVLTDEAKASMVPILERLKDNARGWTNNDLYILGNFDQLIAAAEERGRTGQQTYTQERVQRIQRARTEQPGAPVSTTVNIRGERGTPADKSENVMARAMALAKSQLRR